MAASGYSDIGTFITLLINIQLCFAITRGDCLAAVIDVFVNYVRVEMVSRNELSSLVVDCIATDVYLRMYVYTGGFAVYLCYVWLRSSDNLTRSSIYYFQI